MANNDQSVRDLIFNAREEVLVNKNCQKALLVLNNIDKSMVSEDQEKLFFNNTLALIYLENREYKKAAEIYKEIDEKYHAGFCELLEGNEEAAEKLWLSAPDSGPCRWGKCILDFIRLKKGRKPSFLQIRNYLEIDIGYFIQANKLKYAENLIKNDEIFISINLESYKLIGKALLNHGFLNMARKYLLKSLQLLPGEAETLYFLGRYNYIIGAYKESKSVLERCLESNNLYIPAKNLLHKAELNLDKK